MDTPARRLFITGASGTLGGPLSILAERAGWEVHAGCLTRPERVRAGRPHRFDLRNERELARVLAGVRPDAIIHAAVTERSGPGYEDAIRQAARHIGRAAAEAGIRLVALSTDLVFDGTEQIYTEDSPPRPSPGSRYGHAKADAEAELLALCPAALVVRTSLIYDFDPANAQVAWMLRTLERGETLHLYADQVRCPIWVWNLAAALLELVETDACGLLHVVGPAPVSRYMLGMALLTALGIDPAPHVRIAASPPSQPRRLVLSTERARALLRTPLLSLAEARVQAAQGAPLGDTP